MQLHLIRGGTHEALESRVYNIGIGISLGNKWFTQEHIFDSVLWALSYTREFVLVYVADSIHAINLETRGRMTKQKALEKATRLGLEMLVTTEKTLASALSDTELKLVRYARWTDITDPNYPMKVAYLLRKYEEDMVFKHFIENLVHEKVSGEKRRFSNEDIHQLGRYIIEELPELVAQVPFCGATLEACMYPFDSSLTKFAEQLQLGTIFPEIKNRLLDTLPKVFLEVR